MSSTLPSSSRRLPSAPINDDGRRRKERSRIGGRCACSSSSLAPSSAPYMSALGVAPPSASASAAALRRASSAPLPSKNLRSRPPASAPTVDVSVESRKLLRLTAPSASSSAAAGACCGWPSTAFNIRTLRPCRCRCGAGPLCGHGCDGGLRAPWSTCTDAKEPGPAAPAAAFQAGLPNDVSPSAAASARSSAMAAKRFASGISPLLSSSTESFRFLAKRLMNSFMTRCCVFASRTRAATTFLSTRSLICESEPSGKGARRAARATAA
mmetsp:Transcript_58076/g.168536  ORF Transcript_58076/g.168536 Transcript_58076/m.168536 type:complete len:268 (-) Transcript_58076:343-1146(-)